MPKSFLDLMNEASSGARAARIVFSDDTLVAMRAGQFGSPGPAGPPGAGMTWLGAWSSATMYMESDTVEHLGSSWIAIALNLNSEPPSVNWDLVAAEGVTGDTGQQGIQGIQGIQGATGSQGNPGSNGAAGADGAAGAAGPNTVTTSTTTNITGLLKGNGSVVSQASAPTDYVATADARLSDARTPTAHTHPISDVTNLQTSLNAKQATSEKAAASGYASLDSGTKVPIAQVPTGQTSSTVPFGNDARFTDSRTPLAHAASHKTGGSDAIKLDELAATTDVTLLNASTSAHGLFPKFPGGTTNFFREDGTWTAPVAAVPALIQTRVDTGAANQVIAASFAAYIPRSYEILNGQSCEIISGSVLEIG